MPSISRKQARLARKYIAYRLLTNFWFVSAVWLYFYRLFITDQQVGFLDGMAFAVGLLAEIPAGALADRFGRGVMTRLGQVLAGCGFFLQSAGSSFLPFLVGQAIIMTGESFASGADEALFFDKLQFSRSSTQWRKLVTRGSQAALLGALAATLLGGILHHSAPRIPWVLTGASFIGAAAVVWSVRDSRPKLIRRQFRAEMDAYLADIRQGFRQFAAPALRPYIPIVIIVQGLFYTTSYGLLRLVMLSRFRFTPLAGSVVIACCSLIAIGLLHVMHRFARTLSERRVITAIAASAAAGLLLSLFNIGTWGFAVILVLSAGEHTLYPFMSEVINYHAPATQRATLLSVASFLKALPYVVLGPIIGSLSTHHHLNYFLASWAALTVLAAALYLFYKKRSSRIPVAAVAQGR